jgi:hypothetical protein
MPPGPRLFHPTAHTSMAHIRMEAFGQRFETTLAYNWAGSVPTVAQLLALATELATGAAPLMQGLMGNHVTFREIYCRNIDTQVANEATYLFPPNTFGTRTGLPASLNAACGLIKRTGLTGYGQHGRNSISGFVEGDIDGNSVGAALMTLLANLLLQYLANRVGGVFRAAVAHIPRLPGLTGSSSLITQGLVLDNFIDSQKTRLTGHGR